MTRIWMFVLVFCCAFPVRASTISFSDRAEFEAFVPATQRQGFEEEFPTAASVSFPGFSVTEDSAFANVKSRTDYVSAGERSLGFTWNGNRTLTFSFDPPIDAFAADILDFGTCCGATKLYVLSDTGEVDAIAATGVNRLRGNLQFFGVVTEEPFSTLTMTSDQNSDNDLIVFDEVLFRQVPEPNSGLALLLGAICGVRSFRRRG